MNKDTPALVIAKAKAIAILVGAVTASMISIYQSVRTEQKAKAGYEVISPKFTELEKQINLLKDVINAQQIAIEANETADQICQQQTKSDDFKVKSDSPPSDKSENLMSGIPHTYPKPSMAKPQRIDLKPVGKLPKFDDL